MGTLSKAYAVKRAVQMLPRMAVVEL